MMDNLSTWTTAKKQMYEYKYLTILNDMRVPFPPLRRAHSDTRRQETKKMSCFVVSTLCGSP